MDIIDEYYGQDFTTQVTIAAGGWAKSSSCYSELHFLQEVSPICKCWRIPEKQKCTLSQSVNYYDWPERSVLLVAYRTTTSRSGLGPHNREPLMKTNRNIIFWKQPNRCYKTEMWCGGEEKTLHPSHIVVGALNDSPLESQVFGNFFCLCYTMQPRVREWISCEGPWGSSSGWATYLSSCQPHTRIDELWGAGEESLD